MGQGTEMCPICEENQSEFGYLDYAFFVEEKEFNNLRKNKNHKKKMIIYIIQIMKYQEFVYGASKI